MSQEAEDARPRGLRAFAMAHDDAVLEQVAIILALGHRFRGNDEALEVGIEEEAGLDVPDVPCGGGRVDAGETRARLARRIGGRDLAGGFDARAVRAALPALAEDLYREPCREAAAELLEACLDHPDERLRVAAAASHVWLSTSPERSLAVLRAGMLGADEMTREICDAVVARIAPGDEALERPAVTKVPTAAAPVGDRYDVPGSPPTILIHGTWPWLFDPWYLPGGDLFKYLIQTGVRPNLYQGPDPFVW
jgi:hypothetical protein